MERAVLGSSPPLPSAANGPVVGYFGPATTNTHAAALQMFGSTSTYLAFPTIALVFDAVAQRQVEYGVVPIENSTEGIVRETLDSLMTSAPLIQREYEVEIRHCLLAAPNWVRSKARAVVSHPQALAQCRMWLDRHYPELPRLGSASTAAAARDAAEDPRLLAIASELAADTYGLSIVERGIADRAHNATRFICVAEHDALPSGRDKTTFVFTTAHERGALRDALGVLDDAGVNMMRIESRPLPERRWEYAFVVDVEGHRQLAPVRDALQRLEETNRLVKVLGSYPACVSLASPLNTQ